MIARLLLAALLAATPACAAAQDDALIPKLERLAARGNGEALYHLGMAYQTGSGVALDHRRALDYFRRATAAGDPLAAYKLGCFHDGQDGVLPVDEPKALASKLVAARAGYALAQQDVAAHYARRGNAADAERWLARAAAQGVRDALFGYASLHNGKNGVPRDGAVVVAYFTLFMAGGSPTSEQQAWLAGERATLSPAERKRADQIVGDFRAAPTALTIKAMSGQRAAQALVAAADR